MTQEQYELEQTQLDKFTMQAEEFIADESPSEIGATWLRRHLHIDYRTACHLMDRLEAAGDIGPASDQRLRPVLMATAGFSIFD